MAERNPPFSPSEALISLPTLQIQPESSDRQSENELITLTMPPFFKEGSTLCIVEDASEIRNCPDRSTSREDIEKILLFYESELKLNQASSIQDYLSFAGHKRGFEALHFHAIHRAICPTNAHGMHGVMDSTKSHFMPIPDYLLCHEVWVNRIGLDEDIYAAALGLLFSYLHLIRDPIDYHVALREGLINPEISWSRWAAFARSCIVNSNFDRKHPRYSYGLLDLYTLNMIYSLVALRSLSIEDIYMGYDGRNVHIVRGIVSSNVKSLLTLFLYATLVLGSMQVGLATDRLGSNATYQKVCWIFSVIAITLPLLPVAIILVYLIFFRLPIEIGLYRHWSPSGKLKDLVVAIRRAVF